MRVKEQGTMPAVISPTQQRVILEGVSWDSYACLLADFGDSHAARLAYDQGTLEIMAPSYAHEELNHLIARIVEIIATEMDLDFANAGATTFKRADLERGFEPDSCFYLEHVSAIRGKAVIDVETDPPPDLVVEIDLTHPSLDKLPIAAALGVPEIWRYNREQVIMYRLAGASYEVVDSSGVLPGLTSADLRHWLEASQRLTRPAWMRQVQVWARERWGMQDEP
jgi:Uma2 family endonuclease